MSSVPPDLDTGSAPDPIRRRLLARAAGVLLTFSIGGRECLATPSQARERGAQLRFLEPSEARDLEVLGEALVPGSRRAGLTHYIDQQLFGPPAMSLLMCKYVGVRPDQAPAFYRSTLLAVRRSLARRVGEVDVRARAVAQDLVGGSVAGWQGPPARLAGFVLRSDAVDVVYGTRVGFEQLGVPYMAHIPPGAGWDT